MALSPNTQRVLFSDNGTIADWTLAMNDYEADAKTFNYTVSQDYLYAAGDMPFNHKFFDVGTANAVASAVSVHIWWAGAWQAAVDVIDETSVSGVSLAQSGIIRWSTSRLKGWDLEQDSDDVSGLSTVTGIYSMYWVRFTWNATLTGSSTLKYIGHRFANDDHIYSQYPNLTNLKTAFASGKTNWDEQNFLAGEHIVDDLKAKRIITTSTQILDPELYRDAAVHKAAEIILRGLGDAYEKQRMEAHAQYKRAVGKQSFGVDLNATGNIEQFEKQVDWNFLSR